MVFTGSSSALTPFPPLSFSCQDEKTATPSKTINLGTCENVEKVPRPRCMSLYMYICLYTCTYVSIHVHMSLYMYVCLYTSLSVNDSCSKPLNGSIAYPSLSSTVLLSYLPFPPSLPSPFLPLPPSPPPLPSPPPPSPPLLMFRTQRSSRTGLTC